MLQIKHIGMVASASSELFGRLCISRQAYQTNESIRHVQRKTKIQYLRLRATNNGGRHKYEEIRKDGDTIVTAKIYNGVSNAVGSQILEIKQLVPQKWWRK